MNKRQVGEVSELKVITELISLGYEVHLPWGDNARHDILVEINSDFKKVQVKTLHSAKRDGRVVSELYTTNPNNGNKKQYSSDEVDAFALYYPENDNIYWLWYGEAPSTKVTLALSYKQNQPSVRVADEYLISSKL